MRITINELRNIIREEVFRTYLRSAGFGGSAGLSSSGAGGSIEHPPIGLGDEEEQQENGEEYEQEEKSQFVPRVTSRRGSSR